MFHYHMSYLSPGCGKMLIFLKQTDNAFIQGAVLSMPLRQGWLRLTAQSVHVTSGVKSAFINCNRLLEIKNTLTLNIICFKGGC